MTCCGSCSSKKKSSSEEIDWGPQGFKIVNDDTFIVAAESEFAGWKDGYNQGCECGCVGGGPGARCSKDVRRMPAEAWSDPTVADVPSGPSVTDWDPWLTAVPVASEGGGCMSYVVAEEAPTCCTRVTCGQLPLAGIFVNAHHCWLEVQGCSGVTHRYEVWQSIGAIKANREGDPNADPPIPPNPANKQLGGADSHVVKDMHGPGRGVGGITDPYMVSEKCEKCTKFYSPDVEWCDPSSTSEPPFEWVGCDCVGAAASDYHDKEHQSYFFVGAPNSNTFAQAMIDKCELGGSLPPSAVGQQYATVPDVELRGCNIQVVAFLGTGATIGLDRVTADVFGLPIGVSSEGLHCIVTVTWPWTWF